MRVEGGGWRVRKAPLHLGVAFGELHVDHEGLFEVKHAVEGHVVVPKGHAVFQRHT